MCFSNNRLMILVFIYLFNVTLMFLTQIRPEGLPPSKACICFLAIFSKSWRLFGCLQFPIRAYLFWWRTWGSLGSWLRCRPGLPARPAAPSCWAAAARSGNENQSLLSPGQKTPRCRPVKYPPPPAGRSWFWCLRPLQVTGLHTIKINQGEVKEARLGL